jgi:hypothetical protein
MDTDQSLYAKDTTQLLIELFNSVFGNYFKSYWEATPTVVPPETDFPLVIVQKLRGKVTIGPTSTDEVPETFTISIWLNMADDVGSANIRTTTMRKLQYLVEGQDATTFDWRNDTFMHALRHYLSTLNSGGQWLIDSDCEISYAQAHRPDLPTITMADITLTTQRRVVVNRLG